MTLQNANAMVPKFYLVFVALIFITVMLADTFFPPLGAAFCAFLAYYWISKALQSWLIRLAEKFRKAPLRYPVYRRRKVVTFSSGYLLPWVLTLYRTICKSKKVTGSENLNDSREIEILSNNYPVNDSVDFTSSKCHCSKRKEPLASDEFKTFVSNISEHHIKSWYHFLSKNEDFPKEIEEVLEDAFATALYRVSRLNLNQLTNQLLIIIFNHLYNFIHNQRASRNSRIKSDAKGYVSILTHPAMKDKKSEKIYISSVCEILVDMVVPPKLLHCSLSRAVITDVLTQQLLVPLVNLLSDPCWITWGIAYLLGGSDSLDYSPKPKENNYGISSDEMIEEASNVESPPSGSGSRKKSSPNQLNKTKSFSFDSLDDLGKDNLTKVQQKDFGRSVDRISTPKLETRVATLRSKSAKAAVPDRSSNCNQRRLSSEDNSPDYKALPPYSLYPVLRPKAYKTLQKSVPSPVFDRLPKKGSTLSKLKCSFSLDAISSLAASGLETVQQNVFQNSPSAQNLCVSESEPSTNAENKPLSRRSSLLTPTLDVEEAEEVTEIMNLEPFQNVRIVGTKEQLDPRNKIYILYSIKYEYLKSEENEDGYVEFVEKIGRAERRFKEFIALQSKLEQPELKKYMKGIEGPSKWLSMTISPKDKRNIEKRRVFLEKYLQTLCKRDGIKNNPDLHEFMGFKGDPRIAFVKNASDFPVQRILAKMMGSAFDLIKTALPIAPEGLESGDVSPSSSDKSPNTSRSLLPSFGAKMKTKAKVPALVCHCKRPSNLDEEIRVYLASSSLENSRSHSPDSLNQMTEHNSGNSHSDLYAEGQPAWKKKAAELCDPPVGPRMQGDGCDSFESKSVEDNMNELNHIKFQNLQRTFQYDIPLANTMIDIVLTILFPTHSLSDDYTTVAFKVLFGDLVQAWIQKQLNYLTKSEPWVLCLHSLHETLWPSEFYETRQSRDLEHCRLAALEALKIKFPALIRRLIGEEQLHKNLETFLASLLNETYNRNLLFQVIDVIIEMFCAQELQSAQ